MKYPIYQIDAFTDSRFKGNPAAVVLHKEGQISTEVMQLIAAENNLAETAFVETQSNGLLGIRWFTPLVEVNLCGHATLASAHALFEHCGFDADQIDFQSRQSGLLSVSKRDGLLWLDFPSDIAHPSYTPSSLAAAIGLKEENVLKCYSGKDDLLAIISTQTDIENLAPDFREIAKLDCRGLIVSAPGDDCDFVSRFFAPNVGINEDPVTGSAHTLLTPYWAKRLGKQSLIARQLSPRGGKLSCINQGDRTQIGGNAITYLVGEIYP